MNATNKCLYCDQRYCKCGANDYSGKRQIHAPSPPQQVENTDSFIASSGEPRKKPGLDQTIRRNRLFNRFLFIQAFGSIVVIASLILGLTRLVSLNIAQPISYIGLLLFIVGLFGGSHYDDSE